MRYLIAAAVLGLAGSAMAETWTVDDDGPADFDNIQAAVDAASDGDEILVEAGTYTGTGEDVVRIIAKDIWLHSTKGPDATIIDGESTRRVMLCMSSSTIEGFTITRGYQTSSGGGGGIFIGFGSPKILHCLITENTADAVGGGIYCNNNSNPTLTECTISDNTAGSFGGGIYCWESNPTLSDCVIDGNTANDEGGGIYCNGSNPTLSGCTVSDNTVTNPVVFRSGIYFENSSNATISNCTISDHTGKWSSGVGIRCHQSDPSITDCTISGNGTGIWCSESSPTLTNCEVSGNGGGISCTYSSNPTITDCTILGNTALGGLWFNGSSNPTISGCTISNNTANDGGGIFCWDSNPTISGCTISNNTANDDGGGMFFAYYSSATITDCTIGENTANDEGGGIWCQSRSIPTLVNTSVCGNLSDQIYGAWIDGGGVCVAFSCDDWDGNGVPDKCDGGTGDGIHEVPSEYATIQGAIEAAGYGDTVLVAPGTYTGTGDWVINPAGKPITIRASGTSEETILDGEGQRRVVQCTSGEGPDTVIEGFTITGGSTLGDAIRGGGIYCSYSSPIITGCTISNNTATDEGGGIYCYGGDPTISGCTISNNTAAWAGGGISCWPGSNPTITNCMISNNSTARKGGGICCWESNLTITNCTISNNSVNGTYTKGGGICCLDGSLTISGGTITENTVNDLGGGIYLRKNTSTISSCTISNNTANDDGDGIYAIWGSTTTLSGTGICDEIVCLDTSSIAFDAESMYEVSPEMVISSEGALIFDINQIETEASLNTNVLLESTIGSLGVTNESASLFDASVSDVIPLVSGLSNSVSFSSVVFPPMPPDLGLQLIIEQPEFRGGGGFAVEVIDVDTPDFSDPFADTIDGPPVELISFDADGDGDDELAVLFGGSPGWVAAYDITPDAAPVLIPNLIASVGNDPVDLSAADVDGDGDDDLVIANAGDDSITLLVNDAVVFVSSTLAVTEGMPTSVAFMDWDSSGSLDVAIGVQTPESGVPIEDVYSTRLNISSGAPTTGPSFNIPLYELPTGEEVSDPPTALHGGETENAWGFCGSTKYGRIHHVSASDGLQTLSEVNAAANAIHAGDFDSDGGDGLIDIAASSEEAESLYLFQGDVAGFGDFIPISLNEPVEDFVVVDADSDGDFDFIIAAPDSATADLLLLRNDDPPGSLLQSLGGGVWSFQILTSQAPVSRLTSGTLNNKDDDDDWVIGGGNVPGFGGETAVIEQTNLLNGDTTTCPDINGDGEVGVDEILAVIAAWDTDDADADVNGDGIVDTNDILLVLSAWGPCR